MRGVEGGAQTQPTAHGIAAEDGRTMGSGQVVGGGHEVEIVGHDRGDDIEPRPGAAGQPAAYRVPRRRRLGEAVHQHRPHRR